METEPATEDPAMTLTREEWETEHGEVDPFRFMSAEEFAAAMELTEDELVAQFRSEPTQAAA
jgi:hypothetical protein